MNAGDDQFDDELEWRRSEWADADAQLAIRIADLEEVVADIRREVTAWKNWVGGFANQIVALISALFASTAIQYYNWQDSGLLAHAMIYMASYGFAYWLLIRMHPLPNR